MDREETSDMIYSLVAGFGNRELNDAQNAVFIADKLFNFELALKWKGMGRVGVECLNLYFPLERAMSCLKSLEAFTAGKMLSEYNSRELMLMALYLWNEGRSALKKEEIEEARTLLEKWKKRKNTDGTWTPSEVEMAPEKMREIAEKEGITEAELMVRALTFYQVKLRAEDEKSRICIINNRGKKVWVRL